MKEYVQNHIDSLAMDVCQSFNIREYSVHEETHHIELEDFINKNRKPTLKQVLFSFIDSKGTSDSEVYKKAGIDRKHFSKIRSNPNYRVGKNTIIALSIALELNKKETEKLLSSAGYSLSDSDTYDLVIQFCIGRKIYDIHHVNQALDYFSLKPLTGDK